MPIGETREWPFTVEGVLLTDAGGTLGVAGAGEGARCVARTKLTRIEDERKWFFDVEVREGDRVFGVGTHQRRVVAHG